VSTTRRKRSDPSQNGDDAGQNESGGTDPLDDLLDQLEGMGISAEALTAALSLRMNGGEEWPSPRPLPGTAPVPPWPGGLGEVADAFIGAVAANTATYPDITGMCVLGVTSTVIGGSVVVEGGPGWHQRAILQNIVIARSGEGKTPPYVAAKAPLEAIETAVRQHMEPEIELAESLKKLLEGELRNAEKFALKAEGNEKVEARKEVERLVIELAQFKIPVPLRFYMRDTTPEAIAQMLSVQDGCVGVLTDEASSFFDGASRYNPKGKSNWDIYLVGHDGERFVSDRISRETYDIPHTCLPYLLMGQPVVLEGMGRDRVAAGLGLYARPNFSMPPTMVGHRPTDRPAVSPKVLQDWHTLIASLVKQARGVWVNEKGEVEFAPTLAADDEGLVAGAERVRHASDPLPPLSLSKDAQDVFRDFRASHEPRLDARTGDLGHIAEWGSKLPSEILRMAGNAHALRTGDITGVVSKETMEAALELGDYFIGHALAVFGRMSAGTNVDDALHIRDWLFRHPAPVVTTRDIHTSTDWDTDRVRAAMEFLGRYDWVRKLPVVNQPGRPSEQWALNPALYERGAR
jgi:hypothetical protein